MTACGVIMFCNNRTGEWFDEKLFDEVEKLVRIARTNKYNWIKRY